MGGQLERVLVEGEVSERRIRRPTDRRAMESVLHLRQVESLLTDGVLHQ
jgi:hypothetical protein